MTKIEKDSATSAEPTVILTAIRAELPGDFVRIEELVKSAFGKEGKAVAALVSAIRASDNYVPELSLVAESEEGVMGHIMLSYVELEDSEGKRRRVLALSPLAVDPQVQGQGIGGKLINTAIQIADNGTEPLVVVEGSPGYYRRFGFRYSVPYGISINLPKWAPAEASMVLPLSSYDSSICGRVVYPLAFNAVSEE